MTAQNSMRRGRRSMLIVAAVTTMVVAAAGGAAAEYQHPKYTGSTAVSCDGNTVKDVTSVNHYNSSFPKASGLEVKQTTATTQSSTTRVFFRGPSGNDTTTKAVSNGGTASWTGVKAGVYTVKAYRSTAANCNGALPGNGNYSWSYEIAVGVW